MHIHQATVIMSSALFASLFVLLLLLDSSRSQSEFSRGPSCQIPRLRFDGYLLTLQWPIAFCYRQGACSLERPVHEWIIHGLWPQYNATQQEIAREMTGSPYPQYCCHPRSQVDFAQLEAELGEQLLRVWPTLKAAGRRSPQAEQFSFWRHEWTKHGTCALEPDSRLPFSVEDYFRTALRLYRQFQLERKLKVAQIEPSNSQPYTRAQLHRALGAEDGSVADEEGSAEGIFRLECNRPPLPDSPPALTEIQVCLDRQLRPINCAHLFGQSERPAPSGSFDDFECGEEVLLLAF